MAEKHQPRKAVRELEHVCKEVGGTFKEITDSRGRPEGTCSHDDKTIEISTGSVVDDRGDIHNIVANVNIRHDERYDVIYGFDEVKFAEQDGNLAIRTENPTNSLHNSRLP